MENPTSNSFEIDLDEEKELVFPNSGGKFEVETTGGSVFTVKFSPGTKFRVNNRGDLVKLTVKIETEDVPSPGKLKLVESDSDALGDGEE